MKIQLFYAASSKSHIGEEFLGINRIYAHLQLKNIDCVLTELFHDVDINAQYEKIDLSCEFFGFSIFSDSADFIYKFSDYIKTSIPNSVIFFGSIFASNCFNLIFNDCNSVDIIVLGQGEKPLEDFFTSKANSIDEIVKTHKNLVSRKYYQGKEFCDLDINSLCLPSREILRSKRSLIADLITKHGCAGNCSFCSVREKKSYRSAASIFNEIIDIYKTTGVRCFNISDPSFEDYRTNGKKIIDTLCDSILEYGVKFSFRCFIRADSFKKEDTKLLLKMKKAGFNNIFIGVEAANNNDLKIFKKRATKDDNYKILELLNEVGIEPKYGFIMINPYSTYESLYENFEFLDHFRCADLSAYINCLEIYYNSDIYKKLEQDGMLSESYSYINNLLGYKFIDEFAKNVFEFIRNKFTNSEVTHAVSDYHNFVYMLSYMAPLLGSEAEYFEEQKRMMDAELYRAHNDYFSDIYIRKDLISAEKKFTEYASVINGIHINAFKHINGMIRKYIKLKGVI